MKSDELNRTSGYLSRMRTLRGRKLKSLLLVFVLATTGAPLVSTAVADTVIDEQFEVVAPPGPGYTGYLVNNTRSLVRFWSNIATFKVQDQRIAGMARCKGLDKCPTDFSFQVADVNLKLCTDAGAIDCIAGVTAQNLTTKKIDSTISNIKVKKEVVNNYYEQKGKEIKDGNVKQVDSLLRLRYKF